MNLTIELPDELGAALEAQAQAEGLSAGRFITRVLEHTLTKELEQEDRILPFETGRGIFAKYGPAPTAEEIDANRVDMFRGFAQDF